MVILFEYKVKKNMLYKQQIYLQVFTKIHALDIFYMTDLKTLYDTLSILLFVYLNKNYKSYCVKYFVKNYDGDADIFLSRSPNN